MAHADQRGHAVRGPVRHRRGWGLLGLGAVRETTASILIRIEDNGVGLSHDWQQRCQSGLGVSSAKARLDALYGADASLHIATGAEGSGTTVDIAIPHRRAMIPATTR
ncbi:MAG: hypothetical protein ABJE10_19960 [bacterium]